MKPAPTPEALARGLVALVLAQLETLLIGGAIFRDAADLLIAEHEPAWRQQHGSDVACRAEQILRGLGYVRVLSPQDRAAWLAEAPVMAIRRAPPAEAIGAPTPLGAIVRYFERFWARYSVRSNSS